VIAGELAIFAIAAFTSISFLWYNVIGCLVVLVVGVGISVLESGAKSARVRHKIIPAVDEGSQPNLMSESRE